MIGDYLTAAAQGMGVAILILACLMGICWAIVKLWNGRGE